MSDFLGKNFSIIEAEKIGKDLTSYWIEAPDVVRAFGPGQFVIVRLDEAGERIPLTVVDVDRNAGTLRLIVQVVGRTTAQMAELAAGDVILDLLGPLGEAIPIEKREEPFVIVGGGVGIAPVYPKAKALSGIGNRVISIIGARSKDLLMLEEEMRAVSDELVVTTDDGSYGRKALVTEPLAEVLEREGEVAEVIAVGPPIMMKFCSKVAVEHGAKVLVSLNPIMIDGTGMCGGCRVTLGEDVKFACVDGPCFDGAEIDWDEMMSRLAAYVEEERDAWDHWCKLRESMTAEGGAK
ncbi:MAG: sulfide/dihydroorotate dehydrogenase-like FAD/NAD-binding protein [Planctomycetota bacterium]